MMQLSFTQSHLKARISPSTLMIKKKKLLLLISLGKIREDAYQWFSRNVLSWLWKTSLICVAIIKTSSAYFPREQNNTRKEWVQHVGNGLGGHLYSAQLFNSFIKSLLNAYLMLRIQWWRRWQKCSQLQGFWHFGWFFVMGLSHALKNALPIRCQEHPCPLGCNN